MSEKDGTSLDSAGSEDRFRRLFETYYPSVAHFFRRRGLSEAEVEDLIQETFLRVFHSIASYREDAHFGTWIYRIAWNVWANEIRRQATEKRSGHEISLDQTGTLDRSLSSTGTGPLADAVAEERVRLLRRALLGLPPKMRQCVLLRIDQGLKYREIAVIMGISIDTVKSMLNQARQRLQRELWDYYPKETEE